MRDVEDIALAKASLVLGRGLRRAAGDWRQLGSCVGSDGDLFFPGPGYDERAAKAVCRTGLDGTTGRCPVIDQCREHAVEAREPGIWGGTSAADRRRLRRQRGSSVTTVRLPGVTPR